MRITYLALVVSLILAAGIGHAQVTGACSSFLDSQTVQSVAPWYCSYINQAAQTAWAQWSPAAFAVILVSVMIGVMLFMIGIAIRNTKLKDFGVGELYESMATALIVVFFLAVSAELFGIIPSLITGPVNPYITSLNYVNNLIVGTQNLDGTMFNIYTVDAYYLSTSLTMSASSGSIAIGISNILNNNLLNVFGALFRDSILISVMLPAQAIGELLTGALIVLHVEFYLLLFAMYAAIPVFLIPGIIFRAFLPTRGIGGMLMAVAIGFYMIMPILFSVAYFFTNQSSLQQLNTENSALQSAGQGAGAQYNAETPNGSLSTTFSNLRSDLGGYWISVFFFPDLILAMTYALILTLAEFIGGMRPNASRILSLI